MDRRKALATTGAITLTATAAAVAVGSSIGLFGLTDDSSSRIGKLNPIDARVAATATPEATPSAPTATPSPALSGTTPTTTDDELVTPGTTPSTRPDDARFEERGGQQPDDDAVVGSHENDEDHDGAPAEHTGPDHDEDD
jgi:hypothetical protein